MNSASTSLDTGTHCLEFIIAMTSVIKVVNTSFVSFPCFVFVSIASRIRRAMPIILFQPLKFDACGGLNFQIMRLSSRNAFILLSSTFALLMFNSEAAPTKFVPLSDLNSEAAPHIATNRLIELTNEEEVILSMTTMWTTLLNRQVNNTAQRFEFALPLLCVL